MWSYRLKYVKTKRPLHGMAENVRTLCCKPQRADVESDDPDLQSNMEVCQQQLAEEGYHSIALLVSPHEYFIPQVRWRMVLIFSRMLSLAELEQIGHDLTQQRG